MKILNNITSDRKQSFQLVLDDGTFANFTMTYKANQQGWFYDLDYGTFSSRNRRITNSPNILRAFRNILPFGLACIVGDEYEPIYLTDFISGRATIFLLNSTDVSGVETLFSTNKINI